MSNKWLSIIRHVLTSLGVLLMAFGIDNYVDVLDFVNQNLDSVWAAGETIFGFVITVIGFFKIQPERLEAK